MPRFRLNAAVTGGKYLGEVEAANAAEAEKLGWALDTAFVSLCHYCADQIEDPQVERIDVYQIEEEPSDGPSQDPA